MAGASPVAMSSSVVTTEHAYTSPCLCVDALNYRSGGCGVEVGLNRPGVLSNKLRSRSVATAASSVELSSSFTDAWHGRRPTAMQRKKRKGRVVVVDELGGQYEEGFADVQLHIINYFTYKAVRTVMQQLYEMNPPNYSWLYNFVVDNNPTEGKRFLQILGKERHDLAERVMITRLHLYAKWIKKCDHAKIYQKISDENLELMRERLIETVIWPSDDSTTEKIG